MKKALSPSSDIPEMVEQYEAQPTDVVKMEMEPEEAVSNLCSLPVSDAGMQEALPGTKAVYLEPMTFTLADDEKNFLQTSSGERVTLQSSTSVVASIVSTVATVSKCAKGPTKVVSPRRSPIMVHRVNQSKDGEQKPKSSMVPLTLTLDQLEKAGVNIEGLLKNLGTSKMKGQAVMLPPGILGSGVSVIPLSSQSITSVAGRQPSQPASVMVPAGAGVQRRVMTSNIQPLTNQRSSTAATKTTKPGVSLISGKLSGMKKITAPRGVKSAPGGVQQLRGQAPGGLQQLRLVTPGVSSINLGSIPSVVSSQALQGVADPGKGIRVLSATTGQPTVLPKLSSSVLNTIGPNDQVVVLSAAQLKQLQLGQLKPGHMRTATAKSLTHIAPRPSPIQQVTHTTPRVRERSQSKKSYQGGNILPGQVVSNTPHLLSALQSKMRPSLAQVSSSSQQYLATETHVTTLSTSQPGLGPMEAFETLVNKASEQDKLTDLVQLAMEDCRMPVDNTNPQPQTKQSQLRGHLVGALQPRSAKRLKKSMRYTEIPTTTTEEEIIYESIIPSQVRKVI